MVLLTTGTIAQQLGEDRDHVSYALRKVGAKPIGRAGLVRLFDESVLEMVRSFLASKQTYRKEGVLCSE